MESTTTRASSSGSGTTARLAPTVRPSANLSPDLLLDISNQLDDAADFVRFHAVSKPWRRAAPSLHSPAAACPAFSPWLLALCGGQIVHSTVDLRCIPFFEEAIDVSSHGNGVLAEPPGASSTVRDRIWVACVGGTAAWIFVASPEPRLVNLLTGAVILLPSFPDDVEISVSMENARGIVYSDGTVFLYRVLSKNSKSKFIAAILSPVDAKWRVMKRILEVSTGPHSDLGAVYHDGTVLLCVGEYFWSVLTWGDNRILAGLKSRWSGSEEIKYSRELNYLLESRGEVLWASLLVERDWLRGHARVHLTLALSMTVHTLVEGAGGVMQWVVKDGWSLGDQVLFLGSPASFAVDAHQLGVVGGYAYFVYRSCVFRYGLIDSEAELVKRLRPRWGTNDGARVWVWSQPTIAPIQEIRGGLRLYQNPNKKPKLCN